MLKTEYEFPKDGSEDVSNDHYEVILFQYYDGVKTKVILYRLAHITGQKTSREYRDVLLGHFESDEILDLVKTNLVALVTGMYFIFRTKAQSIFAPE